jgi:hypothetical protein
MRHDLTAPARPPEPLFTLHLEDFPDVTPRHNGLLHWLLYPVCPATEEIRAIHRQLRGPA